MAFDLRTSSPTRYLQRPSKQRVGLARRTGVTPIGDVPSEGEALADQASELDVFWFCPLLVQVLTYCYTRDLTMGTTWAENGKRQGTNNSPAKRSAVSPAQSHHYRLAAVVGSQAD